MAAEAKLIIDWLFKIISLIKTYSILAPQTVIFYYFFNFLLYKYYLQINFFLLILKIKYHEHDLEHATK